MILACLLEPLSSLIDTFYVGQLGTRYVASLAVASAIFSSFTWIFNFLIHVSTQAISFRRGAKQDHRAINLFKISLLLAMVLGILSILLLSLLSSPLLKLAGSTPEIEAPLKEYFFLRLWGQPLLLMGLVVMGTLRAYDKVGKVFIIDAVSVLANVLISGVLIFSLGWGVQGAALGTVLCYGIFLVLGILELQKIPGFWPQFLQEKITDGEWFVLSKNSLHFLGRSAALTLAFFSATKMASQFGTQVLAAHYIMIQLWLFSSFFIDGLAATATLLAAKYLGEGQHAQLRQMASNITLLSFLVGLLFLAFYGSLGHLLWPIFSNDSQLWSTIELFWPLIWASQPLNALAFIADGILFGMEEFNYLRKHIWIGLLLGFLPLTIFGFWQHNYRYLLLGLIALNLYRTISSYLKITALLRWGFIKK